MPKYAYVACVEGTITPFQSNFSPNLILSSSYLFTLFIPAVFLQAQPREYNAQSAVRIREIERAQPALSVGQIPYYMRKSVGQAPTAERAQQKNLSDVFRHRSGTGKL